MSMRVNIRLKIPGFSLGFLPDEMYHTEMIRNSESKLTFLASLNVAILFHLVILFFVKKNSFDLSSLTANTFQHSRPLKVDRIQVIKPSEVEQFRRVGVKNGSKTKYFQPDQLKVPPPTPPQMQTKGLSLGNLAPNLPTPQIGKKPEANTQAKNKTQPLQKTIAKNETPTLSIHPRASADDSTGGHFYFNPKKEKKIKQNEEQDSLKREAFQNVSTSSANPVAQKLSNFEIRYERPEGVSEDELNSDEKAYYSFFKRSYSNYLSKLYATYDRISVERPALDRDLEGRHLLIGKIDYDEKGNIVTVKILKSSDSDNVAYFFEETLKQLNLPNPPKSFIKNKKSFATYYQIQIN